LNHNSLRQALAGSRCTSRNSRRRAELGAFFTMTLAEQIREIMISKEFSDSEKLDRLHALIPLEVFKIDNLNQATPAQLRQLKNCLAITEAMQQLRSRTAGKETERKP
jgi:hypothetical protein